MDHKPHSPADIVDLLCRAEAALSRGEDPKGICRRLEFSSRCFDRWREWAGLPEAGGNVDREDGPREISSCGLDEAAKAKPRSPVEIE